MQFLLRLFYVYLGFCKSTDILCTHHVNSLADCAQLSLQSGMCAGFKYRPSNGNLPNCVNFKKMEDCREDTPFTSGKNVDWKFYKVVHKGKVRK